MRSATALILAFVLAAPAAAQNRGPRLDEPPPTVEWEGRQVYVEDIETAIARWYVQSSGSTRKAIYSLISAALFTAAFVAIVVTQDTVQNPADTNDLLLTAVISVGIASTAANLAVGIYELLAPSPVEAATRTILLDRNISATAGLPILRYRAEVGRRTRIAGGISEIGSAAGSGLAGAFMLTGGNTDNTIQQVFGYVAIGLGAFQLINAIFRFTGASPAEVVYNQVLAGRVPELTWDELARLEKALGPDLPFYVDEEDLAPRRPPPVRVERVEPAPRPAPPTPESPAPVPPDPDIEIVPDETPLQPEPLEPQPLQPPEQELEI